MSDVYRAELDITNYAGKYREMDPETEDLISDGCKLQNGMRVLIQNADRREDISRGFKNRFDDGTNESLLSRAKERNRWCFVSELSYSGDLVSFVALYDDGTKRKRTYGCGWAWLVKKDSIPQPTTGDITLEDHVATRPK